MITRNRLALLLLMIGFFQMAGYLARLPLLRGLGAASGIAPFPKVFCETDGYEGFAASFLLEGKLPDGSRWEKRLDPETYSRLRGPYQRRNVYGAAFAYAPRLPAPFRQALLAEALAPGSAVRKELALPDEISEPAIVILPRPGEAHPFYRYSALP